MTEANMREESKEPVDASNNQRKRKFNELEDEENSVDLDDPQEHNRAPISFSRISQPSNKVLLVREKKKAKRESPKQKGTKK